jgi:hypothetical protein
MAGVNISNVGLLYTNYLKEVSEYLNQESKARNLVKQNKKWTGSHLEWVLHTARNPAIGYVEDGGAFPVPDRQRYTRVKAYRKFVVGSIQLTDGVMATAAGSPNVAKDVVQSEVQGMMTGLEKYENGFFFRNGDGTVATVQSGTTGTTLIVDDARMLWDNAVFEVYDSTLATLRGTLTISKTASAPTSSNYATVTTTANVPSGTVATDKLVWAGTGSSSALNRAITGLDKLIDDAATTFQNVSTTNNPRYTSLVLDNSGSAQDLTPTLFRSMLAGLMQKSGNSKPAQGLKVLTSAWTAINFEEMYEGELRITPDTKTVGLAASSFQTSLGRVDVMVDSDALYKKMFFIDPTKIYRGVQKELHWRKDGPSSPIFKASHTAGVFTATCEEICDLYITDRHTSGKIENLNESPVTMY